MAWEPPELPEDADVVVVRILDAMQDSMDGWTPHDGQPEVALAQEIGREIAATNARFADRVEYAVAGIGSSVFGVPYALATTATIAVTLTVTAAGAVVPAGFMVAGVNPVGEEVNFVLRDQVTTTGTSQAVTLYAADAGDFANGVPAGPLDIVTASATVISAEATGASSGGTDDEPLDAYLDRLTARLSVLRPGGVLAADMVAIAASVPGVARAIGIDNYDALSGATNVEKTVTVILADSDGEPVSAGIRADVQDALEEVREPGFVIYVKDPDYVTIAVEYVVTADEGVDHEELVDTIDATVLAFIAPSSWGTGNDDPATWRAAPVVRIFDIAAVIGSVPGVASIVSLTLNGTGADVALPGPATLPSGPTDPDPSTVSGAVI